MSSNIFEEDGYQLSEAAPNRKSFGLYSPSGSGKTLGAASFVGEEERAVVLNVESGPKGGPGGLETLLHCNDIHPRIKPENIKVLNVRSWVDMQNRFAWLQEHADQLVSEGYTTLILDGGTAMSYLIRQAMINMAPDTSGNPKRHTVMGMLVPTLSGKSTSPMELYQYDIVYDRYIEMRSLLKGLPFTFITTFLEKEGWDDETQKIKVGTAPKLIGKQLPKQIIAEVDGFFHCEVVDGKYVWLTKNNPEEMGATSGARAKHRFGLKLDRYEPADGLALLQKVGVWKS